MTVKSTRLPVLLELGLEQEEDLLDWHGGYFDEQMNYHYINESPLREVLYPSDWGSITRISSSRHGGSACRYLKIRRLIRAQHSDERKLGEMISYEHWLLDNLTEEEERIIWESGSFDEQMNYHIHKDYANSVLFPQDWLFIPGIVAFAKKLGLTLPDGEFDISKTF